MPHEQGCSCSQEHKDCGNVVKQMEIVVATHTLEGEQNNLFPAIDTGRIRCPCNLSILRELPVFSCLNEAVDDTGLKAAIKLCEFEGI